MKMKKQLTKEISKLNQLNEVLAIALYEKCGSVEEYTNSVNNAIDKYKQLHITTMLDRLKADQNKRNNQS